MTSGSSPAERTRSTVRVLTFNVLSADHADWDRRREAAQSQLQALRPDIVAFQETVPGEGASQANDLLGPGYHVAEHPARATDKVGAALASRWPFGLVSEVDLSVTPRVPSAAAVVAEVELPAPFGPTLFVHHGAAYQFGYGLERERQAVTCARFVEDQVAVREAHVVLLGDFNDTPESASVRFWTGRQSLEQFSVAYRDAWEAVHPADPGHTFTPRNPLVRGGEMPLEVGRRIDYVMVRTGIHGPTLDVADAQLACDHAVDGTWASDHFAVFADLQVPAHPPGTWA